MINMQNPKIKQSPEEFGRGLASGLSEIIKNIRKRIYEYGIHVTKKELDNIEQSFLVLYLSSTVVAITNSNDISESLKESVITHFDKYFTSNILDKKEIEFIKDLQQKIEFWSQQLIEIILNPPERPTLNVGRFLLEIAGNQSNKFNDMELIMRLTSDFCIAVNVTNETLTMF